MKNLNGNHIIQIYTNKQHWHIPQINAFAIVVCITSVINISCSSDEDYDYGYHFGQELSTRADGMMGMGNEGQGASRTYPHVNEIKENQTVKDAMDAAWRQALEDANNGIRREYYFLIYYRSNGVFDCSSATPGPVINNCNTHADINITYYDDPDLCAYFHTHTSLKFCPDTLSRPTGPSKVDLNSNIAQQVPCLVRDFESQYLDGGMDHSIIPDSIYIYGVKRRTLEHIGSNNN